MNSIRTQIIKIGNSRGIRIPKMFLEHAGLSREVEIAIERGRLIIRPVTQTRAGWDEQFRTMAERGDDLLLDEPVPTRWEESEWTW
jgi:antitoxin MazE